MLLMGVIHTFRTQTYLAFLGGGWPLWISNGNTDYEVKIRYSINFEEINFEE